MNKEQVFSREARTIQGEMVRTRAGLADTLRPIGAAKGRELALLLADLYAGAGSLRRRIEKLRRTKSPDALEVRRQLRGIRIEIFEIGGRHRRNSRKPLASAIAELERVARA